MFSPQVKCGGVLAGAVCGGRAPDGGAVLKQPTPNPPNPVSSAVRGTWSAVRWARSVEVGDAQRRANARRGMVPIPAARQPAGAPGGWPLRLALRPGGGAPRRAATRSSRRGKSHTGCHPRTARLAGRPDPWASRPPADRHPVLPANVHRHRTRRRATGRSGSLVGGAIHGIPYGAPAQALMIGAGGRSRRRLRGGDPKQGPSR